MDLMRKAVKRLESIRSFSRLIPESQSNLVMALSGAEGVEDVAGIPGRIVKIYDEVRASDHPWFGASHHVARAILTAMKHDPRIRSAMNLRYGRELVETARKLGWSISFYDRREEPEEIKRMEGMTIPWGVETAIKRLGKVPDIIYHEGDWGKEPMLLILGRDPLEVVQKAEKLAQEAFKEKNG